MVGEHPLEQVALGRLHLLRRQAVRQARHGDPDAPGALADVEAGGAILALGSKKTGSSKKKTRRSRAKRLIRCWGRW